MSRRYTYYFSNYILQPIIITYFTVELRNETFKNFKKLIPFYKAAVENGYAVRQEEHDKGIMLGYILPTDLFLPDLFIREHSLKWTNVWEREGKNGWMDNWNGNVRKHEHN